MPPGEKAAAAAAPVENAAASTDNTVPAAPLAGEPTDEPSGGGEPPEMWQKPKVMPKPWDKDLQTVWKKPDVLPKPWEMHQPTMYHNPDAQGNTEQVIPNIPLGNPNPRAAEEQQRAQAIAQQQAQQQAIAQQQAQQQAIAQQQAQQQAIAQQQAKQQAIAQQQAQQQAIAQQQAAQNPYQFGGNFFREEPVTLPPDAGVSGYRQTTFVPGQERPGANINDAIRTLPGVPQTAPQAIPANAGISGSHYHEELPPIMTDYTQTCYGVPQTPKVNLPQGAGVSGWNDPNPPMNAAPVQNNFFCFMNSDAPAGVRSNTEVITPGSGD